jgi:hypothetical protein
LERGVNLGEDTPARCAADPLKTRGAAQHLILAADFARKQNTIAIVRKEAILKLVEGFKIVGAANAYEVALFDQF